MATGNFVSYLRVSTPRQGKSGLGLEAQRQAVADYLNGGRHALKAEHVEIESGKKSDRPELEKAIAAARLHRATLIVAKLDRLSRNAAFLMTLRDSGVKFVAADMPDANTLTVGILALVAQHEREAISARTKAALQAAKRRGTKLGGKREGHRPPTARHRAKAKAKVAERTTQRARDLAPTLRQLQDDGHTTLSSLARELTERGIETSTGQTRWTAQQAKRALEAGARLDT